MATSFCSRAVVVCALVAAQAIACSGAPGGEEPTTAQDSSSSTGPLTCCGCPPQETLDGTPSSNEDVFRGGEVDGNLNPQAVLAAGSLHIESATQQVTGAPAFNILDDTPSPIPQLDPRKQWLAEGLKMYCPINAGRIRRSRAESGACTLPNGTASYNNNCQDKGLALYHCASQVRTSRNNQPLEAYYAWNSCGCTAGATPPPVACPAYDAVDEAGQPVRRPVPCRLPDGRWEKTHAMVVICTPGTPKYCGIVDPSDFDGRGSTYVSCAWEAHDPGAADDPVGFIYDTARNAEAPKQPKIPAACFNSLCAWVRGFRPDAGSDCITERTRLVTGDYVRGQTDRMSPDLLGDNRCGAAAKADFQTAVRALSGTNGFPANTTMVPRSTTAPVVYMAPARAGQLQIDP